VQPAFILTGYGYFGTSLVQPAVSLACREWFGSKVVQSVILAPSIQIGPDAGYPEFFRCFPHSHPTDVKFSHRPAHSQTVYH
jgi:hypothetical protein